MPISGEGAGEEGEQGLGEEEEEGEGEGIVIDCLGMKGLAKILIFLNIFC